MDWDAGTLCIQIHTQSVYSIHSILFNLLMLTLLPCIHYIPNAVNVTKKITNYTNHAAADITSVFLIHIIEQPHWGNNITHIIHTNTKQQPIQYWAPLPIWGIPSLLMIKQIYNCLLPGSLLGGIITWQDTYSVNSTSFPHIIWWSTAAVAVGAQIRCDALVVEACSSTWLSSFTHILVHWLGVTLGCLPAIYCLGESRGFSSRNKMAVVEVVWADVDVYVGGSIIMCFWL